MAKISVSMLLADAITNEIEKGGMSLKANCDSFGDELVFMFRDEHFKWHSYRLTNKQCKKFFKKTYYAGGSYLDKLIRKATT